MPNSLSQTGQADDTHEQAARTAYESYKISLPEERRILVDRDWRLFLDAIKAGMIEASGE